MCVLSCSVMSDSLHPMDCSAPASSVHGLFQTRILEWVAISYSRGSSRSRDCTLVSCASCIGRQILYLCTTIKEVIKSASYICCFYIIPKNIQRVNIFPVKIVISFSVYGFIYQFTSSKNHLLLPYSLLKYHLIVSLQLLILG